MNKAEPKRIVLGENTFAIYPFGAFQAAGLAAELARTIGPAVSGFFAVSDVSIEQIQSVMPIIIEALKSLNGDEIVTVMKKLLVNEQNVSVQYRDENGKLIQSILTFELADNLFIGKLSDVISLMVEVIKLNYNDFFEKLRNQSGDATEPEVTKISNDTVTLM